MFEVGIRTEFNAAHLLRGYRGKCENLHGHNWSVEVTVVADSLDRTGLVVDFKELRACTNRLLEELDHSFLNELPAFSKLNPTSENLARFIFEGLSRTVEDRGAGVKKVTVWETKAAWASYSPDNS